MKNGKPVSGASSYSALQGGIEIEVDTKKEYRRKGLAFACLQTDSGVFKRGVLPFLGRPYRGFPGIGKKAGI